MIHLVAEVRSFERAEIATERVLGHKISRSTIRRLARQVGGELAELAEQDERSGEQLGDGLNWNWSIWKKHFRTFVPILDLIHAIHYVFEAAMALGFGQAEAWATYVRLVTRCWEGGVDAVIEELTTACESRGMDLEESVADDDPRKAIGDAVRYLRNNRDRMDYPRYRRLGLPVTSAPMESLIKQVGMRVKGTEMFWDDPEGGESILPIRAAALSQDQRLDAYLTNRPGWQFVRRTTPPTVAA